MAKQFTTPEAATELGISPAQFRRLVDMRSVEPVDYYKNPHYRSGPECPLWSAKDIGRLKRTKDYQSILSRAKPNPERAKARRAARFTRKYASVAEVLPDAGSAMFNLNRYAKWSSCSREHKEEIYKLKNQFVELLYARKCADRVYLHKQTLEEQSCRRCQGTGQDPRRDDECVRCDVQAFIAKQPNWYLSYFRFSWVERGSRGTNQWIWSRGNTKKPTRLTRGIRRR